MKHIRRQLVVIAAIVCMLFTFPFQAFCHDPPVEAGLAWLIDNQDPDNGTWGVGNDIIRKTATVVEVLQELDIGLSFFVFPWLRSGRLFLISIS